MKVEVLSLGGSLIIPKSTDRVDNKFLKSFKKLLDAHKSTRFIIVVGGGSTARKYIDALNENKASTRSKCLMGIGVTRLHAKFLTHFFGKHVSPHVPTNLQDIKKFIKKHKIVLTGALRYEEDNTSDGTAAKIANYFKTDFINVTDVKGLYTKNPKKYKDARLVKAISFEEFDKLISRMKFRPGQHFILDQHAAKIIKKHKVRTIIVGKDLKNLGKCLSGKKFTGTVIS